MTREDALGVATRVVAENGRWVVHLAVDFWDPSADDGNPVESVWHRIADFPTAEAAGVAARCYMRGADRGNPRLHQVFGGTTD